MDGVRLLTDPVLRNRVGPLRRQAAPPDTSHLAVDAVLISHLHWDHLDLPSLRLLGRDTHLIVPTGAADFLQRQGFRWIEEVGPGQESKIGQVAVWATPAEHIGHRPLFGPVVDSIGFLICGSQQVYFAGDTDLFPEMQTLTDDLDVALLPVWGWGPTLGAGHMDPFRAAQSLNHLCPRVAIPIHWGTYCPIGMGWLQPDFLWQPPRHFARHAATLAPEVEVHILDPGQSFAPAYNGGGRFH